MKKILITGAGSYIGTSFEKYMEKFGDEYTVDTVDMIGDGWKDVDFSGYDCVFHVAGIAHQKETLENAHLYYEVNRNLAVATAKKAKRDGVKQFILLSSMSVYGLETGVITKNTVPHPKSHYGKSKLQADEKIVKLDCNTFKVAILRPPMVYGKGCKGNYQKLRSFALKSPIFPDYPNKRSMVFIGNLCEFVKNTIDEQRHGLFFPQDAEYVNTSKMVKKIANANGKNIRMTKLFNPFIQIAPFGVVKKVFGSLIYEKDTNKNTIDYYDSVLISEHKGNNINSTTNQDGIDIYKKKILFFAPAFFDYETMIANKMRDMGADVDLFDERSVKSAIGRSLLKISPKFFTIKSKCYYNDIIKKKRNKNYDYILIIKGEMIPISILKKMKRIYPNAKLCLYLYDSVKNVHGITAKFPYFDTMHSFDSLDCKKYKRLKFRPLFFADQFKNNNSTQKSIYDICFIGTIHSDRYAIIKQIKTIAHKNGLNCYWFLFLQSKFIYYYYKFTKKEFNGVSKELFNFVKMNAEEIAEIVDKSRIVLDIQHPKQTGLTMRTIEMIGMNKKLITTNEDIVNYDFYNKDNVLVVDRNKVIIPREFINKKYIPISDETYEKYSLENWVMEVLS